MKRKSRFKIDKRLNSYKI